MATNVINIRRFVDVTTGTQDTPTNVQRDWGAFLFVQKGQDGAATTVKKYLDLEAVLADGSNTEAAKAAQVFYGTTYNGVAPTSPFYVAIIGAATTEQFQTNFAALLNSEEYYLIGIDANFEAAERKAALSLIQSTQTIAAHKGFIEDYSADAANKSLEDDTDSVLVYAANNDINTSNVIFVNPSNTQKYYGAAMASFFATRRFNASSRRMASIANKAASGIAPIDLTDAQITVSPTQAFDNIDAKNGNVYANIKIVGLPAWERGNTPSGDDMSDYISADYLNYTITMSVFNALQINPRIPMNNDGAVILASAIELGFQRLLAAGVITGGVSLDGEAFPATGYKMSIPIPTGVAKANGLWDGIECAGLLAGSAKKVIINNILKR